jgi:hypothetical protein
MSVFTPSQLSIICIYSIPLGAQNLDKTSQNSLNIEKLLAGLYFEQRRKLEELKVDFQPPAYKFHLLFSKDTQCHLIV